MEHHNHIDEAIADIDKCLEAPPITIDESLDQAIANGRMTIKEAEECREAYHRCFLKGHEAFDSVDVQEA